LVGKEDADNYTPLGSWITSENPCAAIAILDTNYETPVVSVVNAKGDTITHPDCQKYQKVKIFLYYPETEKWELFAETYNDCDRLISRIYKISTSNSIYLITDVNSWFSSTQLNRNDDKLSFIGSSELWGPFNNGYLISREGDPDDWPTSLFTTDVVIYNPETREGKLHAIPETSQVVYVVPSNEIIVFDKVRQNTDDSGFVDNIDLSWLDNRAGATGYLVKSWSIPDLHCDTLGYFHLGNVRGTMGRVRKLYPEPNIKENALYPRFIYPCSLDYIEVIDTFDLDIKPRVIIDTSSVDAIFGVDSLPVTRPLRYDSRLYIDLDNEPHLRTRRLGIHEND